METISLTAIIQTMTLVMEIIHRWARSWCCPAAPPTCSRTTTTREKARCSEDQKLCTTTPGVTKLLLMMQMGLFHSSVGVFRNQYLVHLLMVSMLCSPATTPGGQFLLSAPTPRPSAPSTPPPSPTR